MIACLMPHSKKKLKPTDVLPFPWDNERAKKNIRIATPEEIKRDVARHKEVLLKKQK